MNLLRFSETRAMSSVRFPQDWGLGGRSHSPIFPRTGGWVYNAWLVILISTVVLFGPGLRSLASTPTTSESPLVATPAKPSASGSYRDSAGIPHRWEVQ